MGKRILIILLLIVFLIAGTQIAFAQEDKLIIDISVDQPIFADFCSSWSINSFSCKSSNSFTGIAVFLFSDMIESI